MVWTSITWQCHSARRFSMNTALALDRPPLEEGSNTLAYYLSSASDKDTLGRCIEPRERVCIVLGTFVQLQCRLCRVCPELSRFVPFVPAGTFHKRAGTNIRPRVVPFSSPFGCPSVVFVNQRRNSTFPPYLKPCFSCGTDIIIWGDVSSLSLFFLRIQEHYTTE